MGFTDWDTTLSNLAPARVPEKVASQMQIRLFQLRSRCIAGPQRQNILV